MQYYQKKNRILRWNGVLLFDFTIFSTIVYKKTDKWYIERQQVTTSDKEWYSE